MSEEVKEVTSAEDEQVVKEEKDVMEAKEVAEEEAQADAQDDDQQLAAASADNNDHEEESSGGDQPSPEQSEGERVAEKSEEEDNNAEDDDHHHKENVDAQQAVGDSSREKKAPPPPFEAINQKARSSVHEKLRAFENRRRTSFQAKLESSSLYWRSFRDLLQSSVHETARAERLVLGTAKAHQAYADAMQASYEDGFLDKRGNVVLNQSRQKRLSVQRVEANISPTSSKAAQPMALTPEERKANMLTGIMEAQRELAKKFGENARELEEEIAQEVTKLRTDLEEKVAGIHKLGDAILAELEKTEAEVSEAWESYYTIADKVLGGNSNRKAFSSDDLDSSNKAMDSCMDVWVVEMQYRVAVSYQSSVWEKASTELSALFASMKETECQRRIDLREYLLAFAQRQERLFVSLPDIYTGALKDLVGRDIDRNTIEEKVQFSIRKRAELLQRADLQKEEAPATVPSEKGLGLEGVTSGLENQELESPLMSELLCKAKVIDRKTPGLVGTWKTTLAVVTADSFLHLFDLPPGRVHSGSAPEVAFKALEPVVHIPSADSLKAGKTFFIKGWCDGLIPTESLALHNCQVSSYGTTFEVAETLESRGASKMFGKTNTRKLTFRTVTEEETADWMQALNLGYI